ncbi:MAG TPA: hypothetical protein VJP40_05520, partial [bacterium]|nr:hypothetical protein [bacterium]
IFIAIAAPEKAWRNCGSFVLGLIVASLPSLYFLAASPQLFITYNLYFHTRIFPGVAADNFRWTIAAKVFLEPQVLILLVGFYAGLIWQSLKGWKSLVSSDTFFILMLLLAYFAIHLSTATPFTQYFSTIVPLLVVGTVPLLEKTLRWNVGLRILILGPLFVFYASGASKALWNEMYSVGTLNPVWKVANVQAASGAIRRIIKPGEPCLTWWPGYAVLGGCESVPGMENHMREHAILRGIPQRLLNDYKMISSEQLIDLLASRKYRVVVDGAYRLDTPYNEYAEYILQKNYILRAKRGLAKIYTIKASGDIWGEKFDSRMSASLVASQPQD